MEEKEVKITIREIFVGLFVAIVGGVLVAWIIQEGGRFQPTNSMPISPTFTSIPKNMPTGTPNYPYVIINNPLILPVKIYADNIYKGLVDSNSTKTLMVDGFPIEIKWEIIKMSNGQEFVGDDMAGVVKARNGETIIVQSTIGDVHYFCPIMSNYTNQDCRVVINEGLESQREPGFINAHTQNVVFGYYYLASNSNVTIYCGNQRSYWGSLPNGQGDSILAIVNPENGVTSLLTIGSP